MDTTLYITQGLPGSGKTTWAKRMRDEGTLGDVRLVSRDEFRIMLHGGFFGDTRREREVTACINAAVSALLREKLSVIIHDTNLAQAAVDHWQRVAEYHKAVFRMVDFTDVPLEVCIRRDAGRLEPVGAPVIRRMNGKYGVWPDET